MADTAFTVSACRPPDSQGQYNFIVGERFSRDFGKLRVVFDLDQRRLT
jgi:hypothetical protein